MEDEFRIADYVSSLLENPNLFAGKSKDRAYMSPCFWMHV